MLRQVLARRAFSRSATMTSTGAAATRTRAFHSPFAVLASSSSPLTTPNSTTSTLSDAASPYEKQTEHAPEPHVSATGTRTYVVSTPDPAHTPYAVPSGAYPNSSPYAHPPQEAEHGERIYDLSASASAGPAHPATTTRVPHDDAGVGESAAVRFRSAPGEMGKRGGGDGGLGLMGKKGSSSEGPEGELPDVNPPPLAKESESMSRMGVKDAWKARK